ncbi:MAG TPA: hypothetical protein VKE69_05610, partial [Planctomycetota bacterium]|nr:hypothetical protein [Planctomycetota bacterium]
SRRWITRVSNLYVRTVLRLPVRDCNSGFRAWRAEALHAVRVEAATSVGPAIVQELLFKAHRAGLRIAEVPIEFVERARGKSTLTFSKLASSLATVMRLRFGGLR